MIPFKKVLQCMFSSSILHIFFYNFLFLTILCLKFSFMFINDAVVCFHYCVVFHYMNKPQSVQFSSVTWSCPTLCDPMDCSMPGLPAHHQLPEFTQTHVHWVSDAIQPSHPLSSPSPPAFYLSQHQVLLQWVSSSHRVAKVLEFQL